MIQMSLQALLQLYPTHFDLLFLNFCFISKYFKISLQTFSVGKESSCNAGDPSSIPGSGRSTGEGIGYPLQCSWTCLMDQLVKNPSAMRETWVQFLGWEDPLGEGKGYPLQYSGLENSMGCIVHGVANSQTQLSDFHFLSLSAIYLTRCDQQR